MITARLRSSPEAERFFADRLWLREKFSFRCPKCKGIGKDTRWSSHCDLCAGEGRVTFELSCELVG